MIMIHQKSKFLYAAPSKGIFQNHRSKDFQFVKFLFFISALRDKCILKLEGNSVIWKDNGLVDYPFFFLLIECFPGKDIGGEGLI